MNDIQIIDITPENIADYGVCGYKNVKHVELKKKIRWFEQYYPKGLRMKVLFSDKAGYQGMIEYIDGQYAHRPVDAVGYLFIHCIFLGFKKEFKGKGYGTMLLEECVKDAKKSKVKGVSVVTRKGSFMAGDDFFVKNGFEVVDEAKPDFHLMVRKFNKKSANPTFKSLQKNLKKYKKGLTILRSRQCPYTEKNVNSILETAKNKYSINAKLVDLRDAAAAQNNPCAFGTFCIIYNGQIISHHPISNTRFENIMKKMILK